MSDFYTLAFQAASLLHGVVALGLVAGAVIVRTHVKSDGWTSLLLIGAILGLASNAGYAIQEYLPTPRSLFSLVDFAGMAAFMAGLFTLEVPKGESHG